MAVPPVIFGGNEPSICQNLLFIKEIFKGSSELASFAPHALKGQKLLAQGIALGIIAISKAPCKGKSFVHCPVF